MIDSLKRPPGALRWAPRQRFSLSAAGLQARSKRELSLTELRSRDAGRDGLDTALEDWARPYGIEPGDGLYLEELVKGPRTVAQVSEALADCGATRVEVQAAADRLFKAGLLDPDPPPPPERHEAKMPQAGS